MRNCRPERGENDEYRSARQRDRPGKDAQQVGEIKDRDDNILTCA